MSNVDDKRVLKALDRETRLVLALSACIIQALNQKLGVKEAVADACKVFAEVFPETEDDKEKKQP